MGTGGAGRDGVKDPNDPCCDPPGGAPFDALRKPDMIHDFQETVASGRSDE